MAIQTSHVQYEWSRVREDKVEVSRLYEDGFLYLNDDPGLWIQSNPVGRLSSVRSLELYLWKYKEDRIGDSIGELSQLTHLIIYGTLSSLKCLPNTVSRLQNLYHLELHSCRDLQELPANLSNLTTLTISDCRQLQESPAIFGGLQSLTSLTYEGSFKSLPNSVAKLSNLTTLNLSGNFKLEELPANLGDLEFLTTLFLAECYFLRSLPWSITKLSMLQLIYLPMNFSLESLPPHMNDSILISVEKMHVRKTWKELKTEMKELFSLQFPIIPAELAEEAAHITSTPGYLRFMGDPRPWILGNHGLLPLVRILDLDLGDIEFQGNIPDSIGEFPQLTHLYITNGCLQHHLPLAFTRITHLSLIHCTFECDTESQFHSLGKLSNLVSLHLEMESDVDSDLPEHMDLPISLRHLTLCLFTTLPSSYMATMSKLCNLNTLICAGSGEMKLLPSNLNLTKLILKGRFPIKSLPIALKHLEIIHDLDLCFDEFCFDELLECLNQGVNLETLSLKCPKIKSLSSVTCLPNLRQLQLKDCFSLKELPPNLDELAKLCSLNVSGTRIKSLPNTIVKLHNLRNLILPKCFYIKSLPRDFENKVLISVDDTDESYYEHENYYDPYYGILNKGDCMTFDSIKGINDKFLKKFRQEAIIEQASPYRTLNHLPDDTQIPEGSHFTGRKYPTSNNNYNAFSGLLDHEIEFLPTENEDGIVPPVDECLLNANTWQGQTPIEIEGSHLNGLNNAVSENNSHAVFYIRNQENHIETSHTRDGDGVVTSVNDIAVEPSSNVYETISCGEHNQEAFQIGRMDNVNLELVQRVASCDASNPISGGSNYDALENREDKNSRSGNEKRNTQQKEIPLERIRELMSQNISLKYAAEEHLGVRRSILKRALKKHDLTWPSSRKGKNTNKNRNEIQDVNSCSRRNSSQLNSVDPSNLAGLGQGLEHLDGPNQHTISVHVPPEPNIVNKSNSDTVIRTVEEPPVSIQCRMDGHRRVEEHVDGAKECALVNTHVHPNESCRTFDVKATYNEEKARFYFSLSSSIEQLKEELGKRFELGVGKIRMYYQDDEKEWIVLACISDLERALLFSKSSGSNVVRLSIKLRN